MPPCICLIAGLIEQCIQWCILFRCLTFFTHVWFSLYWVYITWLIASCHVAWDARDVVHCVRLKRGHLKWCTAFRCGIEHNNSYWPTVGNSLDTIPLDVVLTVVQTVGQLGEPVQCTETTECIFHTITIQYINFRYSYGSLQNVSIYVTFVNTSETKLNGYDQLHAWCRLHTVQVISTYLVYSTYFHVLYIIVAPKIIKKNPHIHQLLWINDFRQVYDL